jgi:membrane fusion protein (multidrug efflux system)
MMLMLAAVGLFIVAIGMVKVLQIRTAMAQGAAFQMPPEAVTTIVTRREEWSATHGAIGTLAAVQGVTVSADLPGIVEEIRFDSGRRVRAGELLVRLDTSQERAQLAAAEAQRNLAKLNLERMRQLRDKNVIAPAELDRGTAEYEQAEARVGEIRATIERKHIRAPFTGVLGIRQINLGQYLTAGSPVVPLQSLDPTYVNFSVPQQDVGQLRVGATVHVSAESVAVGLLTGKITAINSLVDEATRNVQVQATLANPRGTLRAGMYADVQVDLGSREQVIALPASAVSYAPYGNSVFVVAEIKGPDGKAYRGVQQRFVKLGSGRGDQVAIVSGLEPGEEVVTSGVFKLRNGASVLVNNEVRPANDPAPEPENS